MIDNSIPSFYGGLVLVEKISQNIQTKTLPKNNKFGYFVIVTPHDFGIITEGARLILKGLIADDNDKIYCERMLKAFNKGNQKEYCHFMEKSHNWFVTPRINLYPNKGKAFTDVYNAAKNAGANGVTISGSGPTIIAFIDNVELADKVGDAMVNTLKKLGHPSQSRLVDIDSLGAR